MRYFLSFIISYFIVYKNYTAKNIKLLLIVLLIGLVHGFSWPLYVKYFDVTAGTALSKQTQNWSNYEVKPFYYYWSFFTQSGIWTIPSFIAFDVFLHAQKSKRCKGLYFLFFMDNNFAPASFIHS